MTIKIGITLDYEVKETYARYPWYALRENYTKCVEEFGAIAYPLPYNLNAINEFAQYLDGIIITGGDFDIPPEYYGEKGNDSRTIKDVRTRFELELFEKFYLLDKPILGLCGGEQLINVALGGTLIQHIPNEVTTTIEHEQKTPKHQPSHEVEILDTSKLHHIIGKDRIMVNSTHHQAVKNLGKNLTIAAIADDGIIEAIEEVTKKFCLGVQWHPEYLTTEADQQLLKSFISMAKDN